MALASGPLQSTGPLVADAFSPGSRAILLTLILASITCTLMNAIINPILLEVASSFRLTVAIAAQARTIQSAAAAAVAVVAMFVADQVPRKRQLLIGLGAIGLASTGLSLMHSFGIWLLLQSVSGAGAGLVSMASLAATGDYFDETRRGRAMGWIITGLPLAWLLGLPLVGWLAAGWGWRTSYLGAMGVAALAFAGVLRGLPPLTTKAPTSRNYLSGWRQLLASSAARGWLIGETLVASAWAGFLVYLGPFFGVTYRLGPASIGLVLAAAAFVAAFSTSSSAWWANRWGRRWVLLVSTLLAALTISVPLSLRLTPLLSLAALLPYVFLGSIRLPTSSTIALQLLPTARGTMMAARGLTVTVGGMLGTVIAGFLLSVAGFSGIGVGCALLTGAGLAIYWVFVPADSPGRPLPTAAREATRASHVEHSSEASRMRKGAATS